jgi:predicted lactoylglutathione lyase
MLDYFQDLQKLKTNHKFVKNLTFGLSSHFVVKKVSKIIMAKDVFCILVISQFVENFKK